MKTPHAAQLAASNSLANSTKAPIGDIVGSVARARSHAPSYRIDSTDLVAFEMAHEALLQGLQNASHLTITQYRTLSKLFYSDTASNPITQGDLAGMLGIKPNVITQALAVLESEGFVERVAGDDDARTRFARITEAGIEHIAHVNDSVVERLYALFPTKDTTYRTILESAIFAASKIDPPLSFVNDSKFPASRALVSVERIRQETERELKRACGASFSECRIMQRLGEAGTPLRIKTLAEQLNLTPVRVARAVDRLCERGWAQRMAMPSDRKAVYVAVTEQGAQEQRVITDAINQTAMIILWSHLSAQHKSAISKVGHIVVAGVRAQKEAEEKAALNLLQPIE